MFASFHSNGTIPSCSDILNTCVNGVQICSTVSFSILGAIPYTPDGNNTNFLDTIPRGNTSFGSVYKQQVHAMLRINKANSKTSPKIKVHTLLLLFVWITLTVSMTVSTTIPLHHDPLGVDVAGLQGMQ